MTKERDILVPLSADDLVVLGWYAAWTPEVHRAVWKVRRSWPPGFREMADMSTSNRDSIEKARAGMSVPPVLPKKGPNAAWDRLSGLVEYRLLEGTSWGACRLTARGRAALLYHGRLCPDVLDSHCPDVFDDYSLLPVTGINVPYSKDEEDLYGPYKHGAPLPDTKATWKAMLAEYASDRLDSRHDRRSGTACMTQVSSTGMYLSGSLREHHRALKLEITDTVSSVEVVSIYLSLEQLSELLTSSHAIPVTIMHAYGRDGMVRSRTVPPPLSVARRMKSRLERGDRELQAIVTKIEDRLEGMAALPKGAKADVLKDLKLVKERLANYGQFAATQATEEMSTIAESILLIAGERAEIAGVPATTLLLGAHREGNGGEE